MMGPVEEGVLAQVRRRQREPDCTDGSDIASMLAQARYEDGAPMSEQDLHDELVTLLTDGRPRACCRGRSSGCCATRGCTRGCEPRSAARPMQTTTPRVRAAQTWSRTGHTSTPWSRRRCGCVPLRRSSCGGCSSRCSWVGTRSRRGARSRRACTWCTATRRSTRAACVSARAVPGETGRDVHVDPVRGRCTALPGGAVRRC